MPDKNWTPARASESGDTEIRWVDVENELPNFDARTSKMQNWSTLSPNDPVQLNQYVETHSSLPKPKIKYNIGQGDNH